MSMNYPYDPEQVDAPVDVVGFNGATPFQAWGHIGAVHYGAVAQNYCTADIWGVVGWWYAITVAQLQAVAAQMALF